MLGANYAPFEATPRPTRPGHREPPEEQLTMGRRQRATETPRPHLAEVIDAESPEVYLPDVRAGGFRQAGQDCGIGDGLQAVESPSAHQPDHLAWAGAPYDGSLRRTRVGGGEFESVGAEVFASPEPDGEAAFRGM